MKAVVAIVILALLSLGAVALAQEETPAASFGPITTPTPETPTEAAPTGSDARLAMCSAPTLPDFAPYTIRRGDTLGALLTGVDNLTVTQLAVLNCLDDPTALPIGATIWLPFASAAVGGGVQTAVTPETAPDNGAAVAIRSLTSSADEVQNQGEVTFTWNASGEAAYLYPCSSDEAVACHRPAQVTALPVQGALTLSDFRYAGPIRYRLEIVGADEPVTEDITVNITCSHTWIGAVTGSRACPETPMLSTFGAWQPFEGGVMIYFGDSRQIYVMTNDDRRVQVFTDTFSEGMEEPEISSVPDSRFPARRGFGIIWRELGGPESALGWALAEEIGFDSGRQAAGRVSYTDYVQGPGATVYAVTLVPDTNYGFWTSVSAVEPVQEPAGE